MVVTRDGVTLRDGIDYSFSYNATSDTIFITPLSGIWAPNHTVCGPDQQRRPVADRAEGRRTAAGRRLVPGPRPDGEEATFEFESGYTLVVPQTLQLVVPAAGGGLGGVVDGEIFTISRTVGTSVQKAVFEFDSNGRVTDNNRDGVADNFVISFNVASTADEIATEIVTAVNRANSLMALGLSPRNLGLDDPDLLGVVHLGSTAEHDVDISRARSLTRTGQPNGVRDGDSFTIDDGTRLVVFEFDSNGSLADVNGDGKPDRPTARLITFNASQTNDEIAASIALAVNVAGVGLNAEAIGSGKVHLGGTPYVHYVTLAGKTLSLLGVPGVRSAFGIRIPTTAGAPRLVDDGLGKYIKDGDTFSIGDGTRRHHVRIG